MAKSMKLGGGGRFAALKAKAAKSGAVNPGAVAAAAGRKKYDKARFQKLATAGKKRAARQKGGSASLGSKGVSTGACIRRMRAAGKSKAEALAMCQT